jgi:amino acid adenylation domain-containing protein
MLDLKYSEMDYCGSVPDRFRRVMQCVSGEHPAVVVGEQKMSYAQLDRASDQLAARLLDWIGGQPQPISLLLPSISFDTIVAMLGVLKAGHFFLPLDPSTPETVVADIFAECPTPVLISDASLRGQAEKLLLPGQRALFLEDLPTEALERDWPVIPLKAYSNLYYTSGSTGKPRGVIRTHQQILSLSALIAQYMKSGSLENLCATFTYILGAHGAAMWGALLNGATFYNLPMQGISPRALYEQLEAEKISVLQTSPGVLRGLAGLAADHAPFTSLKTIFTGLEQVKREEVEALFRLMPPGAQFVNVFGSTEDNAYASISLTADTAWDGVVIPAGRVPEFTEVCIVDDNGQILPSGETGEIWVRSRFKGGGYWKQPALDEARTAPSPTGSGEPFFKTGDIGTLGQDGLLQFKGRKDFIVKVRGYRIQLEEVEDELNKLADVKEAAVTAQDSVSGGKRLVAYIVAANPGEENPNQIRQLLLQKLPSYKVPARFMFLKTPIPRTPSGKPDRKAMPPPIMARPNLDTAYCPPRNELEQDIAEVWTELLELDCAGANDNFFELGGDSLSSLNMILRIEQRYHVTITSEYFRQPTIAHLAELVAQADPNVSPELNIAVLPERPTPGPSWNWDEMVDSGPLFKKFTLPYGIGVQVQRAWLASGSVRQKKFQSSIELVRDWATRVGDPNPESAIQSSLMANTWWGWRSHLLGKELKSSGWLTVKGDPALWLPRADGAGVVFFVMHSWLTYIFHDGLLAAGRHPMFIRGVTPDPIIDQMGLAVQMHQAMRVLRKGEPVMLAGDGFRGKQGVTIPFWGETRMFRRGGAELAVQTGAELVPVFRVIRPDGHVTVEVGPALQRGNGTSEEQVETLTRAYAELFTARWPQVYSGELWAHLQGWKRTHAQCII